MGVRLTNDELRRFYDAHYGRVLGLVTLVTGTRAAAEDVVHEAVARAGHTPLKREPPLGLVRLPEPEPSGEREDVTTDFGERPPQATLSIRHAAFIGVGAMVGAGIFALLGSAGEQCQHGVRQRRRSPAS